MVMKYFYFLLGVLFGVLTAFSCSTANTLNGDFPVLDPEYTDSMELLMEEHDDNMLDRQEEIDNSLLYNDFIDFY